MFYRGRDVLSLSEFIEAAKDGGDSGLEKVQGILRQLVNPYVQLNDKQFLLINAPDNGGDTALTWAAAKGHVLIVAALLAQEGIEINYANYYGHTALILAAGKGYASVVAALLTKVDIDINFANLHGNTALILAASKGYTAIVAALLAKEGIKINTANFEGNTALIFAASIGHIEIVRDYLLPRLSLEDITKKNHNLKSAAEEARSNGKQEIAALIESRVEELRAMAAQKILPDSSNSSSVVSKEGVPPGGMQLVSNQSSFFVSQKQNTSSEGQCENEGKPIFHHYL